MNTSEIIINKNAVIEPPKAKVVPKQATPDKILGSNLKPLDRLTSYQDPIVFSSNNEIRLLFAEIAAQESVSDIIIIPGLPVMIKRKRRGLRAITYKPLQRNDCEFLVKSLTNNPSFLINLSNGETLSGLAKMLDGNIVSEADYEAYANQVSNSERSRYRYEVTGCSSAVSEQSFCIILRPLPDEPLTYDKLGMSEEFVNNCIVKDGIVCIGAATGEGKSTTLAAIIRYIMENDTITKGIILTHEDPIEVNYDKVRSHHSVVIQSSIGIGQNIKTFHDANRSAMRRSPDLVLVGELRDGDTIDAAIELSLTGHPVFATTHANNVAAIFQRLITRFPEEVQAQKAFDLIDTVRVLMSQKLIEGIDGKMFAVREILRFTPALREYLKKSAIKPSDLYRKINLIMTNGYLGAQNFESQGQELLAAGKISLKSYHHLIETREDFDDKTVELLDSL